ncbi:hypothetical protein MPSEU_000499800 [Mayamaea pseudoterrestris]|nr:hypothetical protein MPSEU_000499800 [Mayamaea pseudoterrestris]
MSSTSWRPTLFQAAAQHHMYQRLVTIIGKTFLFVQLVPMAMKTAFFVINLLTHQRGFQTVGLTSFLSIVAVSLAIKLSSSDKALDEWLRESASRVPMYSFAFSCLVNRYFGTSAAMDVWVFPSALQAIWSSLRLSFGVALLQVVVVLRFVSPISIMRLSTVPLLMSRFDASIRKLYLWPLSVGAPTEPSADPSAALYRPYHGRRFMRPPMRSIVLQFLFSVLAGAYLSLTLRVYVPASNESNSAMMIALACGLTVACTIPFLFAHELWYENCQSLEKSNIWGLATQAILPPFITIGAWSILTSHREPRIAIASIVLLLYSCGTAFLVYFALECYVKLCLFATFDIAQAIDEICPEPRFSTRMHAIILALVYDMDITKEIQETLRTDERREHKRCMELSKSLAPSFLSMPRAYTETPLEEDAFRMAILEAIGGSRSLAANRWLAPRCGCKNTLVSYALVKGLCVLLGAMGNSLTFISNPEANRQGHNGIDEKYWALGPAFLKCSDWALKGLSGFIAEDIKTDGVVRDWRGYDLATLVPAALQSIFSLRKGLTLYEKYQLGTFASLRTAPVVVSLVESCDVAAKHILACLKSPHMDENVLPDLHLEEECYLWIESLALRPPSIKAC